MSSFAIHAEPVGDHCAIDVAACGAVPRADPLESDEHQSDSALGCRLVDLSWNPKVLSSMSRCSSTVSSTRRCSSSVPDIQAESGQLSGLYGCCVQSGDSSHSLASQACESLHDPLQQVAVCPNDASDFLCCFDLGQSSQQPGLVAASQSNGDESDFLCCFDLGQ